MGNQSTSGKLRPEAIGNLLENTEFTEDEIRKWYKEFLKDFPSGSLTIDQFKDVYIQHFPNGDATKFAEHVFRTFDKDNNHLLDFREFMLAVSVTARGGPKDRLRWAFTMYDIDENGFITKEECVEIIKAMYNLKGTQLDPKDLAMTPQDRTEQIFECVDMDRDGSITQEEFVMGAFTDPFISNILKEVKF